MKVVFFGTPRFAVPSLERLLLSTHMVVGVVTQPDRPLGRGHHPSDGPVKRVALRHQLRVLQPERLKDEGFLAALAAFGADVGVVAAYGKILPDALLAIPPRGLFNVHASLLPRYRGAAPVQRAVMAGETQTGVSIMRIVRELDAGPVLAARAEPIGRDETSESVERRLAEVGADLLIEVLTDVESGRACETPQDEHLATYAPRLSKEEGLIDWNTPAEAIHNRIRGLHPWPHAFSNLAGRRYVLLVSAVGLLADGAHETPVRGAHPGEIVEAGRGRLHVAAGAGTVLQVLRIQPEGRRVMDIRDFLAGHAVVPGMTFGSG
jgi:methionyl-tRNA formyltransferase